jgi:hypothetical protein
MQLNYDPVHIYGCIDSKSYIFVENFYGRCSIFKHSDHEYNLNKYLFIL